MRFNERVKVVGLGGSDSIDIASFCRPSSTSTLDFGKMGFCENFCRKFGSGGAKIFLFLFVQSVAWTEISFVHMKDGTALNAPVDE